MATHIMGVLNVTPDSFSDGGQYNTVDSALSHAEALLHAGADYIDIGGQSTRPGAVAITPEEERQRVIPVIAAITQRFPEANISVDTYEPTVLEEALAYPIKMLNDVTALTNERNRHLVQYSGIRACLMHMQNTPLTMQNNPLYQSVVEEVLHFLEARIQVCVTEGIKSHQLLIDPGFGFGKSLSHNMQLLQQLDTFSTLSYPLVVGISRKSMLGKLTGKAVDQRLYAGLAAAVIAITKGAAMIRTHDVAATVDAIAVTDACLATSIPEYV